MNRDLKNDVLLCARSFPSNRFYGPLCVYCMFTSNDNFFLTILWLDPSKIMEILRDFKFEFACRLILIYWSLLWFNYRSQREQTSRSKNGWWKNLRETSLINLITVITTKNQVQKHFLDSINQSIVPATWKWKTTKGFCFKPTNLHCVNVKQC